MFPCYIFPFSFSNYSLSLEERNETFKTPNYILKQWNVFLSKFFLLQSILARNLQTAASNLKYKDCHFCHLQSSFVEHNILRKLDLRFSMSFWPASWGGPKLKTSTINVERQRRKLHRRISAENGQFDASNEWLHCISSSIVRRGKLLPGKFFNLTKINLNNSRHKMIEEESTKKDRKPKNTHWNLSWN